MIQAFSSRSSRTAALAMAVGSVAALCLAPALAQTRAALVQSVDEPARNPYQEVQFNINCRGTSVCNFNFAEVPAGKRLVVTNIAGYLDSSSGGLPNCFLSSGFGGSQFVSLPFTGARGSVSSIGTRINLNQSVLAYFGAGEPVRAFCQASAGEVVSGGAQIMLVGHFVTVP